MFVIIFLIGLLIGAMAIWLYHSHITRKTTAQILVLAQENRDLYWLQESGPRPYKQMIAAFNTVIIALRREGLSKNYIEQLFGAIAVPVIATDISGRITNINDAALRMLKIEKNEAMGTHILDMAYDPEEVMAFKKKLAQTSDETFKTSYDAFMHETRNTGTQAHEWHYTASDGQSTPVLVTVSALHNGHGEEIGYLHVATDISHQHALDQMKSEFVTTVSHELRSPVSAVNGALGLLNNTADTLPEESRTLVDTAYRNCTRLITLINDILDTEKIESGAMDYTFTGISAKEFITESITFNADYAAQLGVEIKTKGKIHDLNLMLDRDRMHQAMTNLLSNAAKFSPENSKIEISGKADMDKSIYQLSIKDYGPGIPQALRPRLFSKFSQGKSGTNKGQASSGLGLFITKQIIESHDGTITFDTKTDTGTTFTISLPIKN